MTHKHHVIVPKNWVVESGLKVLKPARISINLIEF